MTGGVDDVDLMIAPFAISRRRCNGDAAFLFQFHGIHGGPHPIFTLDVMDGMDALGVIQNSLGQGGFTGINVGTDANISDFCDVFFHFLLTFF